MKHAHSVTTRRSHACLSLFSQESCSSLRCLGMLLEPIAWKDQWHIIASVLPYPANFDLLHCASRPSTHVDMHEAQGPLCIQQSFQINLQETRRGHIDVRRRLCPLHHGNILLPISVAHPMKANPCMQCIIQENVASFILMGQIALMSPNCMLIQAHPRARSIPKHESAHSFRMKV